VNKGTCYHFRYNTSATGCTNPRSRYTLVHTIFTNCQPCHQLDECSGYGTADLHQCQSLDHLLRSILSYSVCTSEQWLQQSGPLQHPLAAKTQNINLIQNFASYNEFISTLISIFNATLFIITP
jgi:hypothetical protein